MCDTGLDKEFFSMTPNVQVLKEKKPINSDLANLKIVLCQRHS